MRFSLRRFIKKRLGRKGINGNSVWLEGVDVVGSRVLRVMGWSKTEPELRVTVNEIDLPLHGFYRTYRPDVAVQLKVDDQYLGFLYEYLLPRQYSAEVRVFIDRVMVRKLDHKFGPEAPYDDLLSTTEVRHRDGIYGEGPPSHHAEPCILALAKQLPSPILDFGAGGCALLLALRGMGKEAYGVEVAGSRAAADIPEEARPYVAIYDGATLPFPDGAFAGVLASEVIEHIPDFENALTEIGRVCREAALFTVPDNTIIPICAPAGMIPWHYLAADHVNFFTKESLEPLLLRYFRRVSFSRAAAVSMPGLQAWTNLEALCWKETPEDDR